MSNNDWIAFNFHHVNNEPDEDDLVVEMDLEDEQEVVKNEVYGDDEIPVIPWNGYPSRIKLK